MKAAPTIKANERQHESPNDSHAPDKPHIALCNWWRSTDKASGSSSLTPRQEAIHHLVAASLAAADHLAAMEGESCVVRDCGHVLCQFIRAAADVKALAIKEGVD